MLMKPSSNRRLNCSNMVLTNILIHTKHTEKPYHNKQNKQKHQLTSDQNALPPKKYSGSKMYKQQQSKKHQRKPTHIPQFLIKNNKEKQSRAMQDCTNLHTHLQKNLGRDPQYHTPHKSNMSSLHHSKQKYQNTNSKQYYFKRIPYNPQPTKQQLNRICQVKSFNKLKLELSKDDHPHKMKVKTQGKMESKSSSKFKEYQHRFDNNVSMSMSARNNQIYTYQQHHQPSISEFLIKKNYYSNNPLKDHYQHIASVRTTISKNKLNLNHMLNDAPLKKQPLINKNTRKNICIVHQFTFSIHKSNLQCFIINDTQQSSNTLSKTSNTVSTNHNNQILNTPRCFQQSMISKTNDSLLNNKYPIDSNIKWVSPQNQLKGFKIIKKLQNRQIKQRIQTMKTVESRRLQTQLSQNRLMESFTTEQHPKHKQSSVEPQRNYKGKFIMNLGDVSIDVFQSIMMKGEENQRLCSEIVLDKLNKLGRQVQQSMIPE